MHCAIDNPFCIYLQLEHNTRNKRCEKIKGIKTYYDKKNKT